MKFRKKPVVIEAYQTDASLDIETLEGVMHASPGDWIITGINGEKYPCKPDIFEKTYEPIDDTDSVKELQKALEAVACIVKYLGADDALWGESYWKDRDGDGFHGDIGYIWEGLEAFTEYLKKKIDKKNEIYQDLDDIYEDYTGATEVNFNDMMREKGE